MALQDKYILLNYVELGAAGSESQSVKGLSIKTSAVHVEAKNKKLVPMKGGPDDIPLRLDTETLACFSSANEGKLLV